MVPGCFCYPIRFSVHIWPINQAFSAWRRRCRKTTVWHQSAPVLVTTYNRNGLDLQSIPVEKRNDCRSRPFRLQVVIASPLGAGASPWPQALASIRPNTMTRGRGSGSNGTESALKLIVGQKRHQTTRLLFAKFGLVPEPFSYLAPHNDGTVE